MIRSYLLAATILALPTSAMAWGSPPPPPPDPAGPTATAASDSTNVNVNTNRNTAKVTVHNSNRQRQRQSQAQAQKQRQAQAQRQAQSNTATGSGNNTALNQTYQPGAPAPASFGSFSADSCLGNAGASGTSPMVGLSFQFTHMDHNCDLGRQAHDWAAMGDLSMAKAVLCQTDEAQAAAKALGRNCLTGMAFGTAPAATVPQASAQGYITSIHGKLVFVHDNR